MTVLQLQHAAGLQRGERYELCSFKDDRCTARLFVAGAGDSNAARWVAARREAGAALYCQPNPANADARPRRRTRNQDVHKARLLLVDIDPLKTEADPQGISPEAREQAAQVALACVSRLEELTGCRPTLISSGRGRQVWARVDGLSSEHRKWLLHALARDCNQKLAKVDLVNWNVARLMRLPGGAPHKATGELPGVLEPGCGRAPREDRLEQLRAYAETMKPRDTPGRSCKTHGGSGRAALPSAVRAGRLKGTADALQRLAPVAAWDRHLSRLAAADVLLDLGVREGPAAATLEAGERSGQGDGRRCVATTNQRRRTGEPRAGAGVLRRILGRDGALEVSEALAADMSVGLCTILPRILSRSLVRGKLDEPAQWAAQQPGFKLAARAARRARNCRRFTQTTTCQNGHAGKPVPIVCENLLCGACSLSRVEHEVLIACPVYSRNPLPKHMIVVTGLKSVDECKQWRKLIPKRLELPLRWWIAPERGGGWTLLVLALGTRGPAGLRSASRSILGKHLGSPGPIQKVNVSRLVDAVARQRFQAHCLALDWLEAKTTEKLALLEGLLGARLLGGTRDCPAWPSRAAVRASAGLARTDEGCEDCGAPAASYTLKMEDGYELRRAAWPATLSEALRLHGMAIACGELDGRISTGRAPP